MSHPVNIAATNVIRMPKLSRETISSLFTDVDVTSTTDINCVFATASIGRVWLPRAIHSSENCASHRSYKHMDDGALQYVFACIPIQDIAYGLGFTNISSFNRAFKAQYGMSPHELMEANTRSVA